MEPEQPIGRAHGNDAQAQGDRHRKRRQVGEALARGQLLERDDARGEAAERRPQRRRRRLAGERDAVEHPPGIDGVQVGLRESQHEGRGGEQPDRHPHAARLQLVDRRREPAELPLGVGGVAAVGRVRVGAETGQAQARQLQHGRDGLHRQLGRHAQPLETDVDLDEDVARLRGRLGVRAGAVEVDQRRDQPMGDRLGRGLGQRVRIDEHGGDDAAPAQPDALGQVGHGQSVGAVREEDRAHLGGAVTVAVGLDDGEELARRAHEAPHGPDVRGGGVEVDLERGRPGRARRGRGGHGGSSPGRILYRP